MLTTVAPTTRNLVISALLVVILALFVLTNEKGAVKLHQLTGQKEVIDQEIARIRAERAELTASINRLRSDRRYIEKLAREELGMVRPNEIVYRFQ